MKTVIHAACLASLLTLCSVPSRADGNYATVAYMRSSAAPPWDVTSNETDMNDAFGAGNWSDLRYETADPGSLFTSATSFIYMEGGDDNANALQTFLSNNNGTISTWVSNGGRLFINAAPNQGSDIDLGFGVTLHFDVTNYTSASDNGIVVYSDHPIFKGPLGPITSSFSGGDSFSHAYLTGDTNLVSVIQDDQSRTVLGQISQGSGIVMFGGMTVDIFQAPWPDTHYLRVNIICYLGGAQN